MPVYLPEPAHIPLTEMEMEAMARFIPSQLIGPLLNFETDETLMNVFPFVYERAGECVAEQLTKLLSPGMPWTYENYGDSMRWTNATGKLWVDIALPEFSVDSMPEIDYLNPSAIPMKDLNSFSLYYLAMDDVPQTIRDRAKAKPKEKKIHPEYWRQRVEFLVQRTPDYIQQARDEVSRRYIVSVTPGAKALEEKFFQALEMCRMAGSPAKMNVNLKAKAFTSNGMSRKRSIFGEVLGPKSRKMRKTRKTRRKTRKQRK